MLAIKSQAMKRILNKIGAMNDGAKLNFTEDGLKSIVVDSAHVAMVNIFVDKISFEEYEVLKEPISIDINKMKEIVNLSKNEDIIRFGLNDKENIEISFAGITRTMAQGTDITEPKLPTLNYKTKFVVLRDKLMLATKAASMITDHIIVESNENDAILSAIGSIDRMKYTIPKEDMIKYEYDDNKKGRYNLEYIKKMIDALDDEVEVSFDTDFPIMFKSTQGNFDTTFILAPRIESD